MVADAAMSLDNVVALAAIARGNFWLLALGVLLSIPVLAYGGFILTASCGRAPEIVTLGAALLGWIAGDMAVTDPLVSGWIDANAPALGVSRRRSAPCSCSRPEKARPGPIAGVGRRPRACAASRFVQAPAPRRAPQRAAPAVAAARRSPSWRRRRSGARKDRPAPRGRQPCPASPPRSRRRRRPRGWNEERLVVAGFVLLALVAGPDHLRRLVLRQPDVRHSVARDPTEKP